MKRCWIGGGVLVVLLILGILSGNLMVGRHRELSRETERVAEMAAREDWEQAGLQLRHTRALWEQGRTLGAVLCDHQPMEQVEVLLALLETAAGRRDAPACADICTRLSQMLQALADSYRPSLENLL